MKKDTIGAILKKRIKEQSFTQEQFAEESGISLSALKKYINGTNEYTYSQLIKFAKILDCSYDYLLGFSKSPNRKYHTIKEQLGLPDNTIETLRNRYLHMNDDDFCRMQYEVTNDIINNYDLITDILSYFGIVKELNSYKQIIIDSMTAKMSGLYSNEFIEYTTSRMNTAYMINIMNDIEQMKEARKKESTELMHNNIDSLKSALADTSAFGS